MRHVAVFAISALLVSLVAAAWGDEIPLTASQSVLAAQGKVSFEHDRNKNTRFTVHTKHLARPDSLTPAKSEYVVWVQARGKDPQNIGALKLNDNLEGSVSGTTPYQTFDVIVTAEDSANADRPSGPEIFRGTVQHH
jgi:hypothetical protein